MKPVDHLTDDEFAQLVQRAVALPDAPPALVHAAIDLCRPRQPRRCTSSPRRRCAWWRAVLQLRQLGQRPLALGMRALPSDTRHLLFSAMGRDIDLRISPAAGPFALSRPDPRARRDRRGRTGHAVRRRARTARCARRAARRARRVPARRRARRHLPADAAPGRRRDRAAADRRGRAPTLRPAPVNVAVDSPIGAADLAHAGSIESGGAPPAEALRRSAWRVAWALKDLCYAAWSSEPQRAARAADALARWLCREACRDADAAPQCARSRRWPTGPPASPSITRGADGRSDAELRSRGTDLPQPAARPTTRRRRRCRRSWRCRCSASTPRPRMRRADAARVRRRWATCAPPAR